jgi:hypothetical protein
MVWHYVLDDISYGPVEETELRRLLENRILTLDTPVWKQGMTEWVPFQKSMLCRRSGPWPVAPMRHRSGPNAPSLNAASLSPTMKNSVMIMPGAASRSSFSD